MRYVIPLLLASALPATAAQTYECASRKICSVAADELACVALESPPQLRLTLPDTGAGQITAGDTTAELTIERDSDGRLDMSFQNAEGSYRVILQLERATGRLLHAQIEGGLFTLGEMLCTEAQ